MIDKRRNLPAVVELAMRCALVARNRWRANREPSNAKVATRTTAEQPSHTLSPSDLKSQLEGLSVHPGDTLIVHSSSSAIAHLGWSPTDFLDALQDHLGQRGTLVMPSHPRLKTIAGVETYHVRRSPSQVGLLTELFRRRAGVLRSRYPFASAAADGPAARELTNRHEFSQAPHDSQSPYAKLAEFNAKCLCIGCPLDRLTVLHVAEDTLRHELGIPGFYSTRSIVVRDGDWTTKIQAKTRAAWLWWYLHLYGWTSRMHRRGLARSYNISGVVFHRADAAPTIEWMQQELRRGRSIYPLAWLNRWLQFSDPSLELQP